jgi:hypothetical protein
VEVQYWQHQRPAHARLQPCPSLLGRLPGAGRAHLSSCSHPWAHAN